MATTRHSINSTDTRVLMQSSFEETAEALMEAAAVGEKTTVTNRGKRYVWPDGSYGRWSLWRNLTWRSTWTYRMAVLLAIDCR